MRQALAALHADVAEFINASGMYPAPESVAAKEQADSGKIKLISLAYSQGYLLLESSADHVFALTRLLVEPIQTMAPWTCVRASLESAAISCWLLSDQIDSRERISRSFAFRFEGLSQQLKLARAAHDDHSTKMILSRIDKIEAEARLLGYETVLDKNDKRIGIAQRMPSATDCIAETLDEAALYRTLSAMAHAHPWAVTQLGFHASDSNKPSSLAKAMNSDAAAHLLITAANMLAKPVWAKTSLFGHNLDYLAEILERRYREMGLGRNGYFWVR